MPGIHDLALFIVSGLLLNLTPGPDTLYIVGRSATQGWRAGAVAALGIGAGICVHIAAAAAGLSALLAASSSAFMVVKIAGAAYLVYIGILLLRSPALEAGTARLAPASLRSVFVQGFFTNVLNPKVALFFVAFLPQFVDPEAPGRAAAFLFLGVLFNLNGTLWNLFVAWSSARIGGGLMRNSAFARWFNRCVGGLFVWLGLKLAFGSER